MSVQDDARPSAWGIRDWRLQARDIYYEQIVEVLLFLALGVPLSDLSSKNTERQPPPPNWGDFNWVKEARGILEEDERQTEGPI